jgi:hypothetical protein
MRKILKLFLFILALILIFPIVLEIMVGVLWPLPIAESVAVVSLFYSTLILFVIAYAAISWGRPKKDKDIIKDKGIIEEKISKPAKQAVSVMEKIINYLREISDKIEGKK